MVVHKRMFPLSSKIMGVLPVGAGWAPGTTGYPRGTVLHKTQAPVEWHGGTVPAGGLLVEWSQENGDRLYQWVCPGGTPRYSRMFRSGQTGPVDVALLVETISSYAPGSVVWSDGGQREVGTDGSFTEDGFYYVSQGPESPGYPGGALDSYDAIYAATVLSALIVLKDGPLGGVCQTGSSPETGFNFGPMNPPETDEETVPLVATYDNHIWVTAGDLYSPDNPPLSGDQLDFTLLNDSPYRWLGSTAGSWDYVDPGMTGNLIETFQDRAWSINPGT